MTTCLPLLRGTISLQDALEEDEDILQQLSYPEKRLEFWLHLYQCRPQIANVISRHLNIKPADFRLAELSEWIHGSFNACIPIYISETVQSPNLPRRAIIRFALPYKIGEAYCPGNIDEKLRCEAATYIWLQRHCPEIPIPRLFGFGFPGKQSFTLLSNESIWNRMKWYFRYAISWIYGNTPSPYFPHNRQSFFDLGYLIIEYAEEGKMLSESWEEHRHDPNRKANLFRDLSRIMLRLANLPLPRIGSWTIDNQGFLTLTNRPLTLLLHQLENLQIPTEIPRNLTYTSAEPYLLDLLACHDYRMRYQPNAIHNQGDGEAQLAALTAMRAVLTKFVDRRFRSGPFILSITDIHPSNIFVDDQWNIKCMIDLEWASVRPIEMLGPPHWLSNCGLEQLAFQLDEFTELYNEFVNCFEREELARYHDDAFTQILRSGLRTGSFWYFQALDSPSTLLALFIDHIQPRFAKLNSAAREEFSRMLMPYWDESAPQFVAAKIIEQKQYSEQVRDAFAHLDAEEYEEEGREGSHKA